ncbi:MAG: sigma 54-interacting transcriptional regulator [Acidobacteria bacterium]|nr:sigma 54-interacting transcriptional regulator [Acidobacteriota bacterium]
MDLEPLPAVILAIAEQRSLPAVLTTIIDAVARQPGVALARLWLREPDDVCPICRSGEANAEPALHLRASAGCPVAEMTDWTRINGTFHRIPLSSSNLKIAHIATTGESIRIPQLTDDHQWVRFPTWAQTEGLASFTGHALVFRGESLGALAVFRRTPADDDCFNWLRTMASAAAVAIANARAFEENESFRHQLELERDYLREEVESSGSFGEILGRSPALERVLHQVGLVAATDANVLVLGESGTGKELIARAIHQRSARSRKPLVKVNCGSIPHELFESEFFGHVRGSFTGAIRGRIGRFQLAHDGTLFLDEVGEIPLDLQAKLLRVLQEGEFERVGDEATRRVNVRVVAATNRDLRKEVEEGRFRLDLYYRLGVFPMEVPPLRERKEDILTLIMHFVRRASLRFHVAAPSIPAREIERAQHYDWPGNVRELQNVVERAVIVSRGGKLAFDFPQTSKPGGRPARPAQPSPTSSEAVIPEREWRDLERANIIAALRQANSRISGKGGAADLLGVNASTLASRLKTLGIDRADYRMTTPSRPGRSA